MKLSYVIIAGGKSSRMGTDKALLVFRDKILLQHAIDLFKNFSNDIAISVNNTDYKSFNFSLINDRFKEIGPIGGIYSVLKSCQSENVLLIPVDTPLLSEEILQQLISKHSEDYQATICATNDGLQMLVGVYSKAILPILEKQIQNKDYKLSNLLDVANIQVLDMLEFSDQFINLNTLKDLEQVKTQDFTPLQ